MSTDQKRILLIITGGIAAYKSLELIRLLRKRDYAVRCVLTKGGAEFVTPMSVAALSKEQVYTDIFSLKDEAEMGHIRLSREAELIVVAPATANIIAKMAQGLADDLASTTLMATDKPVMVAPAMNPMMWHNAATVDNVETLKTRGVLFAGPGAGDTACGEVGDGRLMEPEDILAKIDDFFHADLPLQGKTALVTSGPTHEPIDPVRFIGNYSSGKQGFAVARALADAGADTTLVTGPTAETPPANVTLVRVQTALEMLKACEDALPADIAVCAAAVADWRPETMLDDKIKKRGDASPPELKLTENPDILKTLCDAGNSRPGLIIGFAAETGDAVQKAQEKLARKGCDWIVANDVSPETGTFGGDFNEVHLIRKDTDAEDWPRLGKDEVARRLVDEIITHIAL